MVEPAKLDQRSRSNPGAGAPDARYRRHSHLSPRRTFHARNLWGRGGGGSPHPSHAQRRGVAGRALLGEPPVQTTSLLRTPAGWRCSGFSWRVVVGLGSMDLFEGLRPDGPPPTHGWPEVYEKLEFASPEWVDMLRGLIQDGLAGQDLSGADFVLCEEYTNPSAHLRRPGSDSIGFHFRVLRARFM